MNFRRHLDKATAASKSCPRGPTLVVAVGTQIPDNAPPCEICGHAHVLQIIETDADGELEAIGEEKDYEV